MDKKQQIKQDFESLSLEDKKQILVYLFVILSLELRSTTISKSEEDTIDYIYDEDSIILGVV